MQNGHIPTALSPPKGAFGLLLNGSARTAIVFVHGFLGGPRTTWTNFYGLVDDLQHRFDSLHKCDLLFYAYDSVQQIVPLSNQLRRWLRRRLITDEGKDRYEKVILVGHSTGAVLIRHVVVQELEANDLSSPVLRASLRLFAPAHFGAICAGPLGIILNAPLTSLIDALFLRWRPLYHNLVNPAVIDSLRERTRQLCSSRSEAALRACSLFGDNEEIVQCEKYPDDYSHDTVPDHSHTSICKPSLAYQLPLEFVMHDKH